MFHKLQKEKTQRSALRYYKKLVGEKSYHIELFQDEWKRGIRLQSRVDMQWALDRSVKEMSRNDAANDIRRLARIYQRIADTAGNYI